MKSTNFFKKVSLSVENSILNIDVIENPIISDVEINGIKSAKLNEFVFEKISETCIFRNNLIGLECINYSLTGQY